MRTAIHKPRAKRPGPRHLSCYIAVVYASIGAYPLFAADRFWNNPAGGVFGDVANWQNSAVPSSADTANFSLGAASPYTVTLAAPATVKKLMVNQDNLLLDLGKSLLTLPATGLISEPSFVVGSTAGSTGLLEIQNGTLSTDYVRIADGGTATMNLSHGAVVSSANATVTLGYLAGSSGTVSLSGSDVSWTAGNFSVGNVGNATLLVSNGASLVTTDTVSSLASWASSTATATITGPGSSWTGTTMYLYVGSSGHATLNVNDRGLISCRAMNIASSDGSVGITHLDGVVGTARSTITLTGAQQSGMLVGGAGSGQLTVTNGALLNNGGDCWIGNQVGGLGAVSVSGTAAGFDAELRISRTLAIGTYGTGSLTLGTGGKVTVSGDVSLGATGPGSGTGVGTIQLNGGTFQAHALSAAPGCTFSQTGGTLIIAGGKFAPNLTALAIVGGTAADTAVVRLTSNATTNLSGSLSIGGSATAAGPGAGTLSLESGATATFGGATKLWPTGTLNIIGGKLVTTGLQLAGGTFNFSSGSLTLTNSDFTLGPTGLLGSSLTLVSTTGARNALSISGTSTLVSGSALVLSGGSFSTGKLVQSGGTFTLNTGSFALTNDNFTVGSGALLGNTINLITGQSLSVSGAVTIQPGASLAINGGSFSAGSLINNGSFTFTSGTLGGGSDLVVDPGQLLGANLAIAAGQRITSAQGLIVGKTGTGIMALSGGGTATSARGYLAYQAGSVGNVTLIGASTKWTITSTLAVGGSDSAAGGSANLTISSGASVAAGTTVKIYPTATVTVDSGTLSGSAITNQGTLALVNAPQVAAAVTSTGTVTKTGTGIATLSSLTNNATVQIQGGGLKLPNGAGTSTGSFAVGSGTTFELGGTWGLNPNSTLAASSSVSGLGSAILSSGRHIFGGPVNLSQMTIGDSAADFSVASSITHLVLNGGDQFHYPGVFADKPLAVQTLDFAGGVTAGVGPINVSGPINITGSAWKNLYQGTINASGPTLWTGNGTVLGSNSSVFNNLAGATFEARHDLIAGSQPVFGSDGNLSTFNNYGTFVKSTSAVRVVIESVFNNYGTVNLQNGLLQLASGGTENGAFITATGTTLEINDDTGLTTFTPSSSITAAGDVYLRGEPTLFSGRFNVTGAVTGAAITFLSGADIQSLGSSFTAIRTTFSGGVPVSLPPTTLNGELTAAGSLDVISTDYPLSWLSGSLTGGGRFRLNAGANITSAEPKTIKQPTTVDNAGMMVWSAGTINQLGTLNNLASGTIDIQGSDRMEIDYAVQPLPLFNNAGAIIKSGGFTTNISPYFTNAGSVEVRTGSLYFGRGSSSSGTYSVAAGANLGFVFNDNAFSETSAITGAGAVLFDSGDTTYLGRYDVAGTSTIGSSSSSSTTTVTFQPGSSITSLGTKLTINTHATLILNSGNPVTIHDLEIWGTLSGSDALTIDGRVVGRGTITADITNAGEFAPGASPGTLLVHGNYAQNPDASLQIELASLSKVGNPYPQQFDILNITGRADLSGTLQLSLLDGYVPNVGDRFVVLTYASYTGQFDTVLGQDLPLGRHFDLVYGAKSLELVVTVPEPSALALLAVTGGMALRRMRHARLKRSD